MRKHAPGWSRFWEPAFLTSFACYLVLYACLVYRGIYVRGDDFAYLESVVETLARGRLYTHDFIGPYNIFFTLTGVGAYLATGNFYLSTLGVLAGFAVANFLLLFTLFRNAMPSRSAAAWTAVTATFPFYLHKSLDYHGCLPTLTCLLAALLAFQAGRRLIFFIAVGLAVSTRQNSIVLFTLPLYAAAESFLKHRTLGKADLRSLGYLAATLAALALVHQHMYINWYNRNLHVIPSHAAFGFKIARQFGVGGFLGIFFLSLANLAVGGGRPLILLRENLRRLALPLAASVVFALMAFGSSAALVWFQTPLIGSLDHGGRMQLLLKALVLASLWVMDRRLFRLNAYLMLMLGYVCISCLLGYFWDYYTAEMALIAVWITLRARPESLPSETAPFGNAASEALEPVQATLSPKTILAVALVLNLAYAYLYKVQMDKNALADLVFERLERQGAITPERMSGATFGYLGFKLFTLVSEDNPNREQDDFTCYVQADGAVVESGLPWKRELPRLPQPTPPTGKAAGATVLDSGSFAIGFLKLPYRVVDHGNPGGMDICHHPFRPDARTRAYSRRYPLDNDEWREFIRETRLKRRP